jgi:hypothetical protein
MAVFEAFENAYTQTWSDFAGGAGTWDFVASGSHTGSSYHVTVLPTGSQGKYIAAPGGDVIGYLAGWFKITTDNLVDGSQVSIAGLSSGAVTTLAAWMDIGKTGTQLWAKLLYYDNYSTVSSDAVNISTGTWYHFGIKYDTTGNTWGFYLSTVIDLGAAQDSGAMDNVARVPDMICLGSIYGEGTWGSGATVFGLDSIDFSDVSLVHDGEDGAGGSIVWTPHVSKRMIFS